MNKYEEIKKETKKLEKVHGPQLDGAVTVKGILNDVDDLIRAVWVCGPEFYGLINHGVKCDKMFFKTSKELNEKLNDIPENDEVWKKIYEETPECFLRNTMRVYNPTDENAETGIAVFPDLSSEGQEQAKQILKFLGK